MEVFIFENIFLFRFFMPIFTKSIYLDSKRNCDANVYLIDYKKHKDFDKYDMCIVNIGVKNLIDTFLIDCIIFYISTNWFNWFRIYCN